jgi:hypothetical protein
MAMTGLNSCTAMVYRDAEGMASKRPAADKQKTPRQPRASVTFPPEVYETLEKIAREKKVSLAWVVREATENYIADKWPLFKGQV